MTGQTLQPWTKQALVVALVVFILACSFFVWRASMVLYRIEQSVMSMSGDVKKMTTTAGNIAVDVDNIRKRMTALEEKTEDAVGWDDLMTVFDETKKVRESATKPAEPLAEHVRTEIYYLLRQVSLSENRFALIGRPSSGYMAGAYLLGKYKLYANTINSAEQFIDDIATKSITGNTYYVYSNETEKTPLADFMKDALRKYRASQKGTATDDAKDPATDN